MLLRRVIRHVRAQDWVAIAIDFLIVVIGVVVATQVSNWNTERADRLRAASYLERLGDDLDADIANGEARLRFWAQVSGYGAAGLAFAESGRAEGHDDWGILLAYFQASQVDEFMVVDTTYQEMKSAGDLGLVRDEALRAALGNYYALGTNVALSERPRYREHVRGVVPMQIQSYIWNNCYRSDVQGLQTMFACAAPPLDGEIARTVGEIAQDRDLMRELRYWMSTMQVASLIGRDSIERARNLKAGIDSALQAP